MTLIHPVPPDCSHLGESQSVVDVGGENPSSKTVSCIVGSLNQLLHGGELEDALDRSEDLLPGDGHVVLHPGEDGGLDEVPPVPQPLPPALQLGSLRLPSRDERQNLVELGLVNLRSLLHLLLPLGPHLPLPGQLHGPGHEPVVDALLDKCARGGAAALTCGEEGHAQPR